MSRLCTIRRVRYIIDTYVGPAVRSVAAGSPKTPPTRGGWRAPGQGPRHARSSSPKDGGWTTTHLAGVRVFIWICGARRGFRPALAWAPRMRAIVVGAGAGSSRF